jgi:HicB-like antitoxin of HicAB toxin-antitoxin system
MVEDGETLPSPRTIEELRRDRTFREDAKGAVVVLVPLDQPGRAVRLNISMDENLVEAIDRAADTSGQTRSSFLADAARAKLRST